MYPRAQGPHRPLGFFRKREELTAEDAEIAEDPSQVRRLNEISGWIIGAAIEVHRALGPGLLESAYEACLAHELRCRQLRVEVQKPVRVVYKGIALDCGYRLDLLVEDAVVVELKAVQTLHPVFEAQLLSHLKLADKRLGLLINFHVTRLHDGVVRVANNL